MTPGTGNHPKGFTQIGQRAIQNGHRRLEGWSAIETMLDRDADRLNTPTYRATRAAWERIWRSEADSARELATLAYPRTQRIRDLYLPHLTRQGVILEAGCGLGVELISLQQLGYRALGIDYARHALSTLHASRPDLVLAVGDVHQLPYPDNAFDACLSLGVLEHFEFGPLPALREANRVLALGGVLVLSLPYPNLIWKLLRWRRRAARHIPEGEPRYYETAYGIRSIETFVRQAGFHVLERHPIGHSFTLWGLGPAFRGPGYYETSPLAERLGGWLERVLPWPMCFESLVIASKATPT